MAEFTFSCPTCGTFMQCDVAYVNTQIECPACRHPVVVPVPGRAAPAAQTNPQGATSNPKSSSRNKFALVFAVIALAGIGAVVGMMFFGPGKAPNLKQQGTVAPQPVKKPFPKPAKPAQSTAQKKPEPVTVAFEEHFENDLQKWKVVPNATAMSCSDQQNHTTNGVKSARVQKSSDRMYRDLESAVTRHAKVTFWIWDGDQSAAFCEVRGYEDGQRIEQDAPTQALAIGRFDGPFEGGKGKLAGEIPDKTKYQARIMQGPVTGWFNLNGPGVPSRSPGWHRFEIERERDATLKFYVDGILARRITGALKMKWTVVTIGSAGSGESPGEAYFDDIKIVYFGTRTNAPGVKPVSKVAPKTAVQK